MEIALILFYCILGVLWILRGKIWAKSRIKRQVLAALFLVKVSLGIVYGLAYYEYYQTGDIVHYHKDSELIYSTLPEKPGDYLQLTFGYSRSGEVPPHLSYIYDEMRLSWRTQEYTLVRVNSLFNLFSFGHYYVNVVFMSLISLVGLILLHEAFSSAFPKRSGHLLMSICFIPSTLFWCSGIHKDGITLFALSVLIYAVSVLARKPKSMWVLAAGFAAFLLWNTRAYSLLILLPNLMIYWWCLKKPGKNWLRFFVVNLILLFAFAEIHHFVPRLNFLAKLAFEQEFLLNLKGNTHLAMRPIGNSVWSLASNIPMALDHLFLKPIFHKPDNSFQWIAAVDNAIQLILLIGLLCFTNLKRISKHPLLPLAFFFSCTLLLLIGISVPSLGAIVRYKSVALPFLFAIALIFSDPKKWPKWLPSGKAFVKENE
ncbi:MAG: hypothetical protein ACI959_000139 [Limisphaerales bacterium]|jgi:hypothetical protein